MKILFMSQPQVLHPLYDEFCAGAPGHYEIVLYQSELPARPQFPPMRIESQRRSARPTTDSEDPDRVFPSIGCSA